MVLLTVVSLRETTHLPMGLFPYQDKVFHVSAYTVLSVLWLVTLWLYRPKSKRSRLVLIIFIGLFIYGIVIEVLQSALTTTRLFELKDLLANVTGIVLGTLLYTTAISPS